MKFVLKLYVRSLSVLAKYEYYGHSHAYVDYCKTIAR
jgi:hypothetical protein